MRRLKGLVEHQSSLLYPYWKALTRGRTTLATFYVDFRLAVICLSYLSTSKVISF